MSDPRTLIEHVTDILAACYPESSVTNWYILTPAEAVEVVTRALLEGHRLHNTVQAVLEGDTRDSAASEAMASGIVESLREEWAEELEEHALAGEAG